MMGGSEIMRVLILTGTLLAFAPSDAFQIPSPRSLTMELAATTLSQQDTPSSSTDFSMDPHSPESKQIMDRLGLNEDQHQKLIDLATEIVEWNSQINLISRKDCTRDVVYGRHILPSLAPLGLEEQYSLIVDGCRVVDVGTGGGFPGLPLAIAYPKVDFLLLDSVGKKLGAVEAMAESLGLKNVKVHHGRAEDLETAEKFDVCVGRSVAAIPKYCFWIKGLLKKKTGQLCYMIGGDIDPSILDQATTDQNIDQLLDCPGSSDKRALIFSFDNVKSIAAASGEKKKPKQKRQNGNPLLSSNRNRTRRAKGEWAKKDNSAPKQRGYENFKRFETNL